MKQLLSLLLTAIIIFLGFTQKDVMVNWINEGGVFATMISIGFVAILVFFPIIPYPVLAGIIGSVFGVLTGTGISLVGIMIGSMLMFYLSRYGFQQWSQAMLNKYPKVKEYESYFENNAFLGILFVRLLPVAPSPVVNILSGLSYIKWSIFFAATLLGKIPAVLIFTFAGSVFDGSKWLSISIYGIYFLLIAIAAYIHIQKRQSKKVSFNQE